ncbi:MULTISPECIES: MoaD/ThiS family protein [Desulfovibrio]|uniref:MoaD/ThiS family protein n=1 Tax=Desulfovibrio TaxID=872 RepID=UPI0003B59695|nr:MULTISPECIES: MoaD/ThiS family protein [Desulfovibrio]MDD3683537.1 MoaD/ThiS family protein [Desulfovibrio desulfuricans]QTO40955.1 MoaD/ThiS family protein [Desulfovibrio desulfuricans]HZF62446.1 MoaD/ThiS family protein [Desulfovibrio sp.]
MKLTVKLSTTLRDYVPDYVPETGLQVEMPEGSTVAQLAQHLGLPPQDIKIVMVNGRQQKVSDLMRDGDRIAYFPAVGGG